jgi:DNA-binding NarL/FixJ family response regulator
MKTGSEVWLVEDNEIFTTGVQRTIGRLMAEGLVNKEIAEALNISVSTVSMHIQRLQETLNVSTHTGAVAKALREKLI